MAQGTPNYVSTVQTWAAQLTTANAGRDGTGTIVDIATGGTSGSRVDKMLVNAITTSTAGSLRFYVKKAGGSYRYIPFEQIVPAVTVAATTPPWGVLIDLGGLLLESGDILAGSTVNTETFNVLAIGGDF